MQQNTQEATPVIPGYTIEGPLGAGGMARVYVAVQQSFGRPVALKVISEELARNPEFGRRFLREARIIGGLSHPHIVPVYDVGEHEGLYYLAMELFTAGDLRGQMRGTLSEERALEITRQLASALGLAHQKGFIHRDIKPDNVLFRESGEAVLTDFGIARPVHGQGDLTEITQVAAVIGSPRYMSPEQSLGHDLDGRSDIYSLGVMLYQMLVGEMPFPGRTVGELSVQRLERGVPQLPGRLAHLQPLIRRMLAYDRQERFADCAALQRALSEAERALSDRKRTLSDGKSAVSDTAITGDTMARTVVENPAASRSFRGLRTPALLLLVAAAIGLASFTWYQQRTGEAALAAGETGDRQMADGTAPAQTATLETPPPEAFFAFYDAVNAGLVEREKSFIANFPDSVFADMLRVKLADDTALLGDLERRADAGDPRAQLVLSELYDTGWGGEQSTFRAREYARRAAAAGNPFAEYHYAMLVLTAAQTDAERREGLQLLEQSADEGFYLAQTVLANYLLEGRLLGRDVDRGLALLEAAGKQGDRNALFNLARILDAGLHLEQADPERAKGYFERAAALGKFQARDFLDDL